MDETMNHTTVVTTLTMNLRLSPTTQLGSTESAQNATAEMKGIVFVLIFLTKGKKKGLC